MDYQKIAVEELENSALSALQTLGIQATRQKPGVLQFQSRWAPAQVESDIRGYLPHADIRAEADGDGSKGTVKVADVKSYRE